MNAYESIVSVLKINRQAEQKAIAQKNFERLENIKKEAFEYITSKEFVGVVTSLLCHNYSNTPKLCLTSASLPILNINRCVSYEFADKVVDAFQEAGFKDVVSDYDEDEEEYMIILGFDLSNSA
jgi:hypothetical protein